MTDTLHTEPESQSEPTVVPAVDTITSDEAAEAAKVQRKKRSRKVGLTVAGIVAGAGTIFAGSLITANILHGPSQAEPTPVDTPTSETTPTPEATAEAFDATVLDLPANASDQQIADGYVAVLTAELTGNLNGEPAQTLKREFQKPENVSVSVEDFALKKATAIVDEIFKSQYIVGWEKVPNLAGQYQNSINQLAIRIKAYIITGDNGDGFVYEESFSLNADPVVRTGTTPEEKIATLVIKDTNNAEAIQLRQTDNSFTDLNGKSTSYSITYVPVDGKLRIADFN